MKKLLFSLFFVLQVVISYAQGVQEIKGKVVDAKTQMPISSVSVRIQASTNSSLTNNEGNFTLENVKAGNQDVVISYVGYITKRLPVEVGDKVIDLGTISIDEDFASIEQLGIISLTENDLSDDNSSNDTSSGLLQATKDPFQQAAAYNWGSAFFRIRGLDNEYGKTMINGVVMNKAQDGRPQWGNWGGLNDATRNQVFSAGSTPSDFNFGGILGTQNISTRASQIRKGAKAGFSASNTNYTWRPYAIYSSGLNKKGWAFALSASYRGAKEGYFDGTNYDALSLFAAVEKKFNDNHSLNFTAIYAQNKRGKNSPITDEQAELKDFKYNSYWGWQNGDKRNSRYKDVSEPIFQLTHYWKIDEVSNLTTTASYQFGHIANSRLGYIDGINPDPTYYKKLPSYFLNKIEPKYWSMTKEEFESSADTEFVSTTRALLDQAQYVKDEFQSFGQINWDEIYTINQANGGASKIMQYEDRQDDKTFSFNTNFKTILSDHVTLDAGFNYRRVHSNYYKKAVDLLGGEFYMDLDTYQDGGKQDSDLNNPNRAIGVGDKFGYNYTIDSNIVDVFTQFNFDYDKFDFYVAQKIGYTSYERDGKYRNAVYANDSYGKSGLVDFNNYGFKGGVVYHLTGRHAFSVNAAYYNQAPTIRNTFANSRLNNLVTKDLTNEDVFSIDGSYIVRTPKLKARVSGYLSEIKNGTQINFYYADGVGIVDDNGDFLSTTGGAFVSEILTGVNKRNIGVEIGAEYQLTQTLKATAAATIGQSIYTNNPNLRLNSDNVAKTFDYGTAYMKDYRTGNGPQTALSLGLEYRDPAYWWVGANINYMDHAYTNISGLRRTENFVKDPATGQPFSNLTEDKLRSVLKQEQLADFTVVNITGGKSWRLPNRNIIGFFASVNNLFNKQYKTGGFEQARNANYEREMLNTQSGTNTFSNKYWYAYGRNFFVNVYYNF
ncbi:TonB-dependent receptor [Myroides marinus]|uniref:TonB-dependent receptor n=1 Tax=Myroides marinus TaxID=703342 RepID=A0A163Z8E5_9FLAO|nr:TonB-dependent receptor [Myroides marinus]KZE81248.1 TonB-dependent receptor [Myroides marinus]MDM1346339.1 TonB-dependent receptor [Myroides marinus]MDM1351065.1 TonB-dependent receptor [Myroides marinus]MDM1353938.1 TonB-dependent receptor [Myroides marinus]MDM1358294.1 TonB-dependent receptor [Myroides marinus]